jgi:site-specific DNA-methyltransferase (adenine-specific)
VSANSLYFGENLEILRNEIKSESVDLIYLDPPFNSKANYNVLFRSPKGHKPHAQIEAFEDTWHWGEQAEREFAELIQQPNTDVSEMTQALRRFLGENDMMAYLTMMANRLLELRRVLKPNGAIYLHCDPTASHYLKIVLDGVFGKENFRNEVIWQRTSSHNDSRKWPHIHDILFFYAGKGFTWNPVYLDHNPDYVKTFYRFTDKRGRYRLHEIIRTASMGPRPNLAYEYKGYTPEWGWRMIREKVEALDKDDRLEWSSTGRPYLKRYLHEQEGTPASSIWSDIPPISFSAAERLGYPTQKPLELLERLIRASSNEGDVVLDPFCGCGTAIHAAAKLKRKWVGIDITHLAISLVENRLRAAFPGIDFQVHGTPKDFESAHDLAQRDKYQFQWWACSLVNAQPYQGKKKGADSGIDGVIYVKDDKAIAKKIVVSVKAGEHVSVPMIRDLGHVINREKASQGFFVTLTKPTAPMRLEAVKAGYYQSPVGPKPKIQILTIEGLLAGTEKPDYFDLMQGGLMSQKPKREADAVQLPFDSRFYLSEVQATDETPRKPARVARAAKPRKASRKTA